MIKEIDYIEEVDTKFVKNSELRVTEEDLPIEVILEGRKKYILKMTPIGLVLNKKD